MRIHKTALLLSFVCLLNCSSSIHEKFIPMNLESLELKQDGKYLLYKHQPMEGIVVERYASRQIRRQSHYKNGLLDGKVSSWYQGGQKESMRFYKEGEKEGLHVGWWPNGNIRFEYQFANGLYNGSFKEWYENGKMLHLFEYDHGNEVSAIGWRDNGKTYINFIVRNGKKYGLTNSRLCYSLKDEQGIYQSSK